jgi:uncharacterized protein (DUF2141 family)
MRISGFALLAMLVCANPSTVVAGESSCPGIHMEIRNIDHSRGNLACALFDSPESFPYEILQSARNVMAMKIHKTEARCEFLDIPPGTYAIAVIHDENMNGRLDTNALGFPTEGYGFSNDATGTLGPPSFADASFSHDGQTRDLTISLHY